MSVRVLVAPGKTRAIMQFNLEVDGRVVVSGGFPLTLLGTDNPQTIYDNALIQTRSLFAVAHTRGSVKGLPDREIDFYIREPSAPIAGGVQAAIKDLQSLRGYRLETAKAVFSVFDGAEAMRYATARLRVSWKGLVWSQEVQVSDSMLSVAAMPNKIWEDVVSTIGYSAALRALCQMPLPVIELERVEVEARYAGVRALSMARMPDLFRQRISNPGIVGPAITGPGTDYQIETGLVDQVLERPAEHIEVTVHMLFSEHKTIQRVPVIFRVGGLELK